MSSFILLFGISFVSSIYANLYVEPPIYDTSPESLHQLFQKFQTEYNRNYASIAEESMRYLEFVDNIYKINQHNSQPNISYILDITKFADWTSEEFNKLNNLRIRDENYYKNQNIIPMSSSVTDLPESIDWSTVKPAVVTPVKNQGNCGSCWAFGATGSWESRWAINNGVLNSLSEQELIDCVPANDCILGGFSDDAFAYGIKNSGDAIESDYPYKAHDGQCQASSHKKYDPLQSMTIIQRQNETAMMVGLQSGPITVAVDAQGWNSYRSGVFTGKCGTNLDHNVMMVGYGVSGSQKYWKIKNSWGPSWGMSGYILLCRDCGKNGGAGECGVNLQPSFPNVFVNKTYTQYVS